MPHYPSALLLYSTLHLIPALHLIGFSLLRKVGIIHPAACMQQQHPQRLAPGAGCIQRLAQLARRNRYGSHKLSLQHLLLGPNFLRTSRTLTPLHGAGRVQPLAQLARRLRATHGGHQLSLRQLRQARQAARGRHQRPEVCLRHALHSTRAACKFACLCVTAS